MRLPPHNTRVGNSGFWITATAAYPGTIPRGIKVDKWPDEAIESAAGEYLKSLTPGERPSIEGYAAFRTHQQKRLPSPTVLTRYGANQLFGRPPHIPAWSNQAVESAVAKYLESLAPGDEPTTRGYETFRRQHPERLPTRATLNRHGANRLFGRPSRLWSDRAIESAATKYLESLAPGEQPTIEGYARFREQHPERLPSPSTLTRYGASRLFGHLPYGAVWSDRAIESAAAKYLESLAPGEQPTIEGYARFRKQHPERLPSPSTLARYRANRLFGRQSRRPRRGSR